MAFETQTINIKTKQLLNVSEFAVNTKISLDSEAPLKKILSIKALSDVITAENVDVDYTANGKTQIDVVYLTENNTLESITGFADWQNSTKAVGEDLCCRAEVVEVSVESIGASEISVNILQNMFVEGVTKQEIMPIANLPEDYVAKFRTVNLKQIKSIQTGRFMLSEKFELPNAQKLLSIDACCKTQKTYCGIDQVTAEGGVEIKALYLLEEGSAILHKTIDFKQEIACLGAINDCLSHAKIYVTGTNAILEIGEKITLAVSVSLCAQVEVYSNKEFEVITDCFSISQKVNSTIECIDYESYESSKTFTDTVVSNVSLNDGVDELLGVISPSVQIAQYYIDNGRVVVDGVIRATIIYKNNELEQIDCMHISFPFVCNIDSDGTGEIKDLRASVFINSAKIRSGKEIEVVCDLNISLSNSQAEYFEYTKSIVPVEKKEENSSAITIYVTKENESLFSVAKALNVLPEVIANQNEVVDGKFTQGQRIFVYNPLKAEF